MVRGLSSALEEPINQEAQQDAPSNGGQRSCLNPGFHPRRGRARRSSFRNIIHRLSPMKESDPAPEYTLDHWGADYQFVCSAQQQQKDQACVNALTHNYFQHRYGEQWEIRWLRLRAAMLWVEDHWNQIDGPYTVVGEGQNLMNRWMMGALYCAFSTCPKELLHVPVPVDVVLNFAAEFRKP